MKREEKEEEKNLLLKDLCARLPYGVKCQIQEDQDTYVGTLCRIEIDNKNGHLLDFAESINGLDCQVYLSEVKPYLFPLSSMTEEQRVEAFALLNNCDYYTIDNTIKWLDNHPIKFFDWCNKNHFDYRGLIPMGLANDATGLNIY